MARGRNSFDRILVFLFMLVLIGAGAFAFLRFSGHSADEERKASIAGPQPTHGASALPAEELDLSTGDESPSEPGEASLSVAEQADRFQQRIAFDPAREPNWKLRREYYRDQVQERFAPPQPGQTVKISLKGNRTLAGTLVSTNEQSFVVEVGKGEMEIAMSDLSVEGRALFFKPEAMQVNATRLALRERELWRSKKAELEKRDKRSSNLAAGKASGPPQNSPPDGAVHQVVTYLNKTLPDPTSTEFIEWSQVGTAPEGYRVRCKYKAKKASGGYVIRNQIFLMNESGKIVDVLDPRG